jgi:predicted TIM-barrel fold metal-dependent hydrolase
MFSSDYPHWDFDDPFQALPTGLTAPTRHAILSDNAVELYSLQDRLAARAPDRAALNPELA